MMKPKTENKPEAPKRIERRMMDNPIKGIDAKKRTIETYSSTNEWDRYGERFEADAFAKGMDNYLKNPVFMWGHDYSIPPIGKGISHSFDSKGLIQTFQFAETPMANDVLELYKGGFLNAVSVGFNPTEVAFEERVAGSGEMGAVFKQAELLETSAVPIPANPGALVTKGLFGPAMRLFNPKGEGDIAEWLKKNLKDEETDSEETLKGILKYFKDMGKMLKGGKVSEDAERSLLIQANNVIRGLVYGENSPNLDADHVTAEQIASIEKEANFLMEHLKDGADLAELENILKLLQPGTNEPSEK